MRKSFFKPEFLAAAFLMALIFITAVPAAAVSDETTVAGVITKVMPEEGTIEIKAESIWNGETWTGVSVTFVSREFISGTVPDSALYGKIKTGDPVQATFTGDEEYSVNWLCIGKVQSGGSTGKYLSDAFGDPKYVISPFFNNFKITYQMLPDCSRCSGSTCASDYAGLRVSQGWEEKNLITEYTIAMGERHVFTSPDGCESEFSVTLISGKAKAASCPGYPAAEGPVSVNNFVISVVQKGTVSDMTPAPVVTPTETQSTPMPTQTSGFVFAGTLIGIFAAVFARGGRK
ncbi:MAG: hypothetical protein JXQ82_07410 [Methanomicrobiaceae archaeon]|nr:hypothetical protein [Methanomicrobiaceae archaeon]